MSDMDYDKISDLIWEQSYRDDAEVPGDGDGDGMRAAGEAFDHLRARVVEMQYEMECLGAEHDVRRRAYIRAINRWRAENPGSEMTLPDHADLVVWLLEQHNK